MIEKFRQMARVPGRPFSALADRITISVARPIHSNEGEIAFRWEGGGDFLSDAGEAVQEEHRAFAASCDQEMRPLSAYAEKLSKNWCLHVM